MPPTISPTVALQQPDVIEEYRQSLAEGFMAACTATLWFWNGIISIPDDAVIFSGRRLKLYDYTFFLSRFLSGGLILSSIGFLIATTETGCKQVLTASTWFEALALISTSSMFLFRVLAVFADSLGAKIAFTLLWLTTFLALSVPFSTSTKFESMLCNISHVKPDGSAGFIAVAIFDTLVFMAISHRLFILNRCISPKSWLATFDLFCGKSLGSVSRVLLQTGQIYWITTVGSHIFTLFAILSPPKSFSPTFTAGFTLVNVGIQNIMACEVFRLLRLEAVQDDTSSQWYPSLQFAQVTRDETGTEALSLTEVTDGSETTI
ncbi:hypothetical protein QCA50_002523 [Cerrena zonata]|uniref:Uncharacterized protein n=1 Tax=Cerrena zonata TaxID=2478898 RepID=A0AAW0GRR5_9APHY